VAEGRVPGLGPGRVTVARVVPNRIETHLYDADGQRTDDEALAVRAVTVEVDEAGNVVKEHEHDGLAWKADPISLEGDAGELATRPKHEE
jgi:hypothetical protein